MKLVVVESPAKAKTIEKYLGPGYRVLASYGHVRDLPPKDGSVDPDAGFAMLWETYADKARQLKAITDEAKKAESLILATDPDREGEAISWHVQEVLGKRRALPAHVERVTFNAITKSAVTEAMKHPRALDEDLIDAYRARRALDYLVGFTLSPVLWRKLPGAKSAGRVQSVALRLIVDREREIELFRAQEYWSVAALMEADGQEFTARLVRLRGDKIDRLTLGDRGSAEAAKQIVEDGRFTVATVETRPLTSNPPPPFTTSTLQQEAARKLGFSASHTMRVAQGLYEDGAITYMRTDGVDMAPEAISAARRAVVGRYDAAYVPEKPRHYQTKAKNAQEAHEAIRPTDFDRSSLGSGDHGRLYDLIWKRALASQMASARLERTTVELPDGTGQTALRATGQVTLFPGYLALYEEGRDDPVDARGQQAGAGAEDEESRRLPRLREGDVPAKKKVNADQHFTQPPPRYSEASLVKKMEELGIGRPSTYAATLQTLKDRDYVRLEKNRFIPEESGRLLTAFLERFFERYVSYDFTAGLEDSLDEISGGRAQWQKVLEAFWRDFKPKTLEIMEQQPSEITAALDDFLAPWLFPDKGDGGDSRLCPACGEGRLGLRGGRFGAFVACSNYPECKFTRRFGSGGDEAGVDAGPTLLGSDPDSGEDVSLRTGRFGAYVQLGEGKEAKRASIPRDLAEADVDLIWALKLLSLPRTIGDHPETGKPITASIGRYGPYLAHDGKYAKLGSTAEVLETGMNAAVAKLADAARGGGRARGAREPLRILGAHPRTEAEIRLMEGRFGPYVTDGATNATLPKSVEPDALTLEEAAQLIDDRAARGPPAKKGRGRKPAARKKAPAKKGP
jgi:DNA topoisomerase-1